MEYYIKSERVLFEDGVRSATLLIKDGRFADVLSYDADVISIDYGTNLIIPGLFDSHTHGYAGYSFTSTSTVDDIQKCLVHFAKNGITSIFASSSRGGYKNIIEVIKHPLTTQILGIHAEGPFLSDKRRGIAKPGTEFIKPNALIAEQFYNDSNGYLKMMTVAPENENADKVIDYLRSKEVKVAIGHTNATSKEFWKVNKSIDLVTHLGNAMSGIHHRNMGVFGAALLSNLPCELIADGMHINSEMLEIIFRIKPKSEIMLVSDTTALAGVKVGEYKLDYGNIFVQDDGVIINEFGAINGSSRMILQDVEYLVKVFGVSVVDAVNMASINPARVHGLDSKIGSIKVKKDANYAIIDDDFKVIETYREGECIYNKDTKLTINTKLESLLMDPNFMNSYM